jgi:hypothetical protein
VNIEFEVSRQASLLRGTLVYRVRESSFDFIPASAELIQQRVGAAGLGSIAIGTLQIAVAVDSGQIQFVWGYLPRESWVGGALQVPRAHEGGLRALADFERGVALTADSERGQPWLATHDRSTGWLRMSPRAPISPPSREDELHCEFATDSIASLAGQRLVGLWLHPELGL